MKFLILFLILPLFFCGFKHTDKIITYQNAQKDSIVCTKTDCTGTYRGHEFVNGADIAHQFSNKMATAVGNKLKTLYLQKMYCKVDFSKIEMTTVGMGSGKVTYTLSIPFVSVANKCDAYTSFDHVGGWNHSPALLKRKRELSKVLIKGHELNISDLKTTPEGLQEYWIQWKNKKLQTDCN